MTTPRCFICRAAVAHPHVTRLCDVCLDKCPTTSTEERMEWAVKRALRQRRRKPARTAVPS